MQIEAIRDAVLLLLELSLEVYYAARGIDDKQTVPHRHMHDETTYDTAVSQYLYSCIMHDHAPRAAARGGRAAMHA